MTSYAEFDVTYRYHRRPAWRFWEPQRELMRVVNAQLPLNDDEAGALAAGDPGAIQVFISKRSPELWRKGRDIIDLKLTHITEVQVITKRIEMPLLA